MIAGEAAYGSRKDRWDDQLSIASAIVNRAVQTGQSIEDVVGIQSQFNAYNKALPSGADKFVSMAQKALDHVIQNGPVHQGTFYATPAAVKNLPSGLVEVASTTGHKYFTDPLNRAIKTVKGFIKPSPQVAKATVSMLSTKPVEPTQAAIKSALQTASYTPYERPGERIAAGLNAPSELAFRNPGQSGINQSLADALSGAGAQLGRSDMVVNSGYRSPAYNASVAGAKNSLHTQRMAADVDMRGMSNVERQQLVQELAQRGAGGFITYSKSPNMLHVDMRKTATGEPHFMFDKTASKMGNAPDWFKEMASYGGIKTPERAPVPEARPETQATPSPEAIISSYSQNAQTRNIGDPRGVDNLSAAPASEVERGGALPSVESLEARARAYADYGNTRSQPSTTPDPARFSNQWEPSADRFASAWQPSQERFASSWEPSPERFASSWPNGETLARTPVQPSAQQMAKTYGDYAASRNAALAGQGGGGATRAAVASAPAAAASALAGQPASSPTRMAEQYARAQYQPASASTSQPSAARLADQYSQYRPSTATGPTQPSTASAAASYAKAQYQPSTATAPPQTEAARLASLYSQAQYQPATAVAPTQPTVTAAPKTAAAAVTAPVPTAAPQTFSPAPSLQTQFPAPSLPQMPAPTPPVAPLTKVPAAPKPPTPATATPQAASYPPAPRLPSAADVYAGRAPSGVDSAGNAIARDAKTGNTSITNKYGATTITMPDGRQAAPISMSGFGGLGAMARSTAPMMAGAYLGSAGGPIGMALGAMVGRELAKPGGGLIGKLTGLGTGGGAYSYPSAPKYDANDQRINVALDQKGMGQPVGSGWDQKAPGVSAAIAAGRPGLY